MCKRAHPVGGNILLIPGTRPHPDKCLGDEDLHLLGRPDEAENRRSPGAADHPGSAGGAGRTCGEAIAGLHEADSTGA